MLADFLGPVHLAAAVLSMVSGAIMLMLRKGTRMHRRAGYVYVALMFTVLATSLAIYDLTGGFNVLHGLALAGAVTLFLGLKAAWQRKAGWLERHYRAMAWSYIGLIAAFVSESATRLGIPLLAARGFAPGAWFWGLIAFSTFVVTFVGAFLLELKKRRYGWKGIS